MASRTEDLLREIRDALRAIEQRAAASGGGSAGTALSARRNAEAAPLGSLAAAAANGGSGILAAAARHPLAAVAGATVGAAGAVAFGGLQSVVRGGDFEAGAGRSALGLLSKTPLLGEGAAQADRILQGTESDLNSLTNPVARFGGPRALSPQIRTFLASEFVRQNRNVEEDRLANEAGVNRQIPQATEGRGVAAELVGAIVQAIQQLRGSQSGGGAGQHA